MNRKCYILSKLYAIDNVNTFFCLWGNAQYSSNVVFQSRVLTSESTEGERERGFNGVHDTWFQVRLCPFCYHCVDKIYAHQRNLGHMWGTLVPVR